MRPLRGVLLTKPYELLLSLALFCLGVLMIASPSLLNHTPIGFETRGLVHHIWHYSLILGSGLTLIGLFWDDVRFSIRVELAGLIVLFVAIAENLIALLAAPGPVGGMLLAFRVSTLAWLIVRCYALLTQPVVYVLRGVRDE